MKAKQQKFFGIGLSLAILTVAISGFAGSARAEEARTGEKSTGSSNCGQGATRTAAPERDEVPASGEEKPAETRKATSAGGGAGIQRK